jgi:UDP-3-O-[3-hydroxymyristoyl] N-acetylglucosamine deacetylase/3-hydroxyacyl-[acyl-carrier-protein] dehydratase
MEIMVKQKTIKTEVSLTGVGLHTGKGEVKMTFKLQLTMVLLLLE